ncbi:hypothetical protein TNCV_553131 [Trichonephila clavipes]|nr:hypothetical protein TNCV_553131 [Trichonephila clavipes]
MNYCSFDLVVSDADYCAVGLGIESRRRHGCCKCIVPLRQGEGNLNSCLAENPFVRLVKGEERHGQRAMNRNRSRNAVLVDMHFIYGLANGNGRVAVRLFGERYPTRSLRVTFSPLLSDVIMASQDVFYLPSEFERGIRGHPA